MFHARGINICYSELVMLKTQFALLFKFANSNLALSGLIIVRQDTAIQNQMHVLTIIGMFVIT